MMRKILRKTENGQAMIEFAVILPVLITILMAVLDFGMLFLQLSKVEFAAQEGARYAGINYCISDIGTLQSEVEAIVESNTGEFGEKDSVRISGGENTVTVTVTYNIKCLTFITTSAFGSDTYKAVSKCTSAIYSADT